MMKRPGMVFDLFKGLISPLKTQQIRKYGGLADYFLSQVEIKSSR